MAITTRDGLVAAGAAAYSSTFFKASITGVAGFWYSLFRTSAGRPAASTTATPTTTGRTLNRTDPGALTIPSAGSNTLYALGGQLAGGTIGTLMIADRLEEYGGLSGTTTTAQTLSALTLPSRAGTGDGYQMWLDWYTATGSTAVTATVSYTNQAGTSGQTSGSVSIAASTPANRCLPVPFAAGDTGVRAAASVTISATTGTAGSFGVTIRKPLLFLPITTANVGTVWGYAETLMQTIPTDACLEMLVLCSTTSTGALQGLLNVGQG